MNDFHCKFCGHIVSVYEQRLIKPFANKDQLCYDCVLWLKLAEDPGDDFYVIDNCGYRIEPIVKKNKRVKHILTKEGKFMRTTELICYGAIPERFHHLFSNTAHFISHFTYRKLKSKDGYRCRKLGCWDRLHCVWFNEENKNWNKIPKNHIIGTEECPIFINKKNPHGK